MVVHVTGFLLEILSWFNTVDQDKNVSAKNGKVTRHVDSDSLNGFKMLANK